MQDHLTLRNVELMLARYLQLHPANLSKVINLNLIAAISPFVDIAHQDQLETPEMLAKAAKVSEIYQSAGDLENVVELLEKGQPGLITVVHF